MVVTSGSSSARGVAEEVITELSAADQEVVRVYPNPVYDEVFVEYGDQWTGASLTVYSLSGAVLMNLSGIAEGQTVLDGNRLETGTYLMTITKGTQSFTQRLIKQ